MYTHVPPKGVACWEGCHFIGNNEINEKAAPFFRKKLVLPREPLSAAVFVCGLGFHELYINGVKAGNSFLTPAQSIYDRTVYYNTYDATLMLRPGENTFYVLLGNGLYNCEIRTWDYEKAPWRDKPKLLFYADILLRGGRQVHLASDSSFETGESAITYNTFYGGETQDYTKPEDGEIRHAVIVKSPGGVLRPFPKPHVREQADYRPLAPAPVPIPAGKKLLFDFGQNMAGWTHVDAEAAGRTRFTLRYGEKLDAAANLDVTRIAPFVEGGRFQTDEYILDASHPIRDGRPHFTYYGFRYVELSVEEGELVKFNIRSRALNSDLQCIGNFLSSNDYVNRIYNAGQKASLSNLVNVPTDCPHREKNGWTGDAALSAEQMCLNLDMREFYRRWLSDIRDAQRPSGQLPGIVPTGGWGFRWGSGPVWDSALFELPLAVYTCYGDTSLLLENREAMKRYLDFCGSMAEDYVVDFGLGDWCPPEGGAAGHLCPTVVSDTATYFKMVKILALVSDLAGERADQVYYETLATRIKESFARRFVDPVTGVVKGNCQTGQAMALCLGLVEGDTAGKVLEHLCQLVRQKGCLDFGILGAKYVFEALSLHGQGQLAMDLILRKGFPSYRHWLDDGATTMAESWNRDSSDNHHMFSDVCRWFIRYVAGLNKVDFVTRTITFTPDFPSQLNHAGVSTGLEPGQFFCYWEREAGGFSFTCLVPKDFSVILVPLRQGRHIEDLEEKPDASGLRRNFFIKDPDC
ncbi:MAG: family 78 glycoside hydrolase catalytic domain [Treponema sp.]|nr:family 78 glycoside hydrolase catalytic domain [Treponema sp.]